MDDKTILEDLHTTSLKTSHDMIKIVEKMRKLESRVTNLERRVRNKDQDDLYRRVEDLEAVCIKNAEAILMTSENVSKILDLIKRLV